MSIPRCEHIFADYLIEAGYESQKCLYIPRRQEASFILIARLIPVCLCKEVSLTIIESKTEKMSQKQDILRMTKKKGYCFT